MSTETLKAPAPRKRKYRVLSGYHSEGGKREKLEETASPMKFYKPGDVVESEFDLTKLNTPKGRKFEALDSAEQSLAPAAPARDEFDQMSLEQLKAFIAEENEGLPKDQQFTYDAKANKRQIADALRQWVPPRGA